jgi:transposase
MLTNAIRAHLAEFGVVAKIGREGIDELLLLVRNGDERIRRVTDAMASVSLVRSEPAPT